MKLYTSPGNPTGRKAEAVLQHLGLDYEIQEINFQDGDSRSDAFKAINPSGLVPALVDGERKVWESNAIMLYLCMEKSPGHGLFKSGLQTEILQWLFWETAQYNASLRIMGFERIVKPMMELGETDEAIFSNAHKNFERWATVLNDHLSSRDFMVGDDWTLADYGVGYAGGMTEPLELDLSAFPNVAAYYKRFEANPHWAVTASKPQDSAA